MNGYDENAEVARAIQQSLAQHKAEQQRKMENIHKEFESQKKDYKGVLEEAAADRRLDEFSQKYHEDRAALPGKSSLGAQDAPSDTSPPSDISRFWTTALPSKKASPGMTDAANDKLPKWTQYRGTLAGLKISLVNTSSGIREEGIICPEKEMWNYDGAETVVIRVNLTDRKGELTDTSKHFTVRPPSYTLNEYEGKFFIQEGSLKEWIWYEFDGTRWSVKLCPNQLHFQK